MGGVLPLFRGAVSVFYSPSRPGNFPKGISSKLNVIARLEFEHVYFKAAVQHFSDYVFSLLYFFIVSRICCIFLCDIVC